MSELSLQSLFYKQLRPQSSASGRTLANWIIVFLILSGFALMAVETESSLPPNIRIFLDTTQVFIVFAFALEFALRLWAMGADDQYRGFTGRLRLLRAPLIWMDFLAFAPETIVLLAFPAGILASAFQVQLHKSDQD